jgi:superfamily II DNA or RNA helicase
MEEKSTKCKNGTRKKNGKCLKGSMKVVNGKEVWVFDIPENLKRTEKGTRKRCPPKTTEYIENGVKYCVEKESNKSESPTLLVDQGTKQDVKIPCGKRCPNGMKCKDKFCIFKEPVKNPLPIVEEPKPIIEEPIIKEPIIEEPIVKSSSIKPSDHPITEKDEYDNANDNPDNLYPNLNDPLFNVKLSEKKEFNDIPFDNKIYNVEEKSEELCLNERNKKQFEFLPHQLFVRNFMSQQTPYNSLLLYHSVGTGKTLSAISIAEDMRYYLRQLGIRKKIIIVCAPNVQKNFEKQFFDETKLIEKKINGEKRWSINSGIGSSLLKEINPSTNDTRDDIIKKVNKLRSKYYEFYGYGALRNEIENILPVKEDGEDGEKFFRKKMRLKFDNRLIIIDEVHNIHNIQNDDNNFKAGDKKKLGTNILKIARYAENARFVLLSATPIYNSYNEIIFLTNLMNLNDKRKTITIKDVFDNEGNFLEPEQMNNGLVKEGGKELLMRKLSGYISFVRGENPYTFPFRIYPNDIPDIKKRSILNMKYPTKQLNNEPLAKDAHIRHLDLIMSQMDKYQSSIYKKIKESVIDGKDNETIVATEEFDEDDIEDIEDNDDSIRFSYNKLQKPLQALNIVFPNSDDTIENCIGNKGLENSMDIERKNGVIHFNYKKNKFGNIFSPDEIGKYSSKIKSICDLIKNSKGIVLVYAYYIYGGIIPLALALEEMGFNRYSSNSAYKNLMKPQTNSGLNYLMITGNKELSYDNAEDVKYVSGPENKDGKRVKVILISKSGSEGLDFKNIRQIHIMDSWYTLNRIEQIIGRGVRTLSHCSLPLEERSVEIYLHASLLEEKEQESADLYIYRYAENKAIQLGKIYRVLKQISVDCILNQGQKKMSITDLNEKISLNLSTLDKKGKQIQIEYNIGDKPYTNICDYMGNCDYQCVPNKRPEDLTVNNYTYNNDYMKNNNGVLVEKIKTLYRDKHKIAFTLDEIVYAVNAVRQYPLDQIYYALTHLIKDKNELMLDSIGRLGNLINKDKFYIFQPLEITDTNASIFERINPVDYKQRSILIPEDYKHSALMFNIPKEQQQPENKQSSFDELVGNITEQYRIAFIEDKLSVKGKLWSESFNFVLDELKNVYKITLEDLHKYFIFHLFDTFSFEEKLVILRGDVVSLPDNIADYVKLYFESKQIQKTIILYDKESNSNKYFVKSKGEWTEKQKATFEEIVFNNSELKGEYQRKFKPKMILKNDELNGFMTTFKNVNVVFKVREGGLKFKDKGTYVSNGNRNIAVKLLNKYLETNGYKNQYSEIVNKKDHHFDKYELSVILEILMRHQEKRKFLSPEQYHE